MEEITHVFRRRKGNTWPGTTSRACGRTRNIRGRSAHYDTSSLVDVPLDTWAAETQHRGKVRAARRLAREALPRRGEEGRESDCAAASGRRRQRAHWFGHPPQNYTPTPTSLRKRWPRDIPKRSLQQIPLVIGTAVWDKYRKDEPTWYRIPWIFPCITFQRMSGRILKTITPGP